MPDDFHIRRGRHKTPINGFLCVDDYGNAVFKCRYTNSPVSVAEGRIVGNTIPQANVAYVAKRGTESLEKESRRLFHESEANCNMCQHFRREPYDKKSFAISGVFHGTCAAGKQQGVFPVAPDDWMGMGCWTERRGA